VKELLLTFDHSEGRSLRGIIEEQNQICPTLAKLQQLERLCIEDIDSGGRRVVSFLAISVDGRVKKQCDRELRASGADQSLRKTVYF